MHVSSLKRDLVAVPIFFFFNYQSRLKRTVNCMWQMLVKKCIICIPVRRRGGLTGWIKRLDFEICSVFPGTSTVCKQLPYSQWLSGRTKCGYVRCNVEMLPLIITHWRERQDWVNGILSQGHVYMCTENIWLQHHLPGLSRIARGTWGGP